MVERGHPLDRQRARSLSSTWSRADERPSEVLTAEVARLAGGGSVKPKTVGQKRYVDAIASNIVTFGIGPAGTGKSWLAVAMAVQALQRKQVERIVLTRPAVEAGERLGLPARRPDGQGRPVPSTALRRALRHGRRRGRGPAARAGHGRGRAARLHARPHAQQQLHHPRRGAEHHARADEDVPHPHRVRFQGGHHRRRDPGRRRRAAVSGLVGLEAGARRDRRSRVRASSPAATSCGTGSSQDIVERLRTVGRRSRRDSRTETARRSGDPSRRGSRRARGRRAVDRAARPRPRGGRSPARCLDAEGVRARARPTLCSSTRRDGRAQRAIHMGVDGPTDVLSFPIDGVE